MEPRVKRSFICANVQNYHLDTERLHYYVPQVGDVAIFEVLEIGKHTRMQGTDKRSVTIMPGDHIMCAFGTRYATGQFEGYVPTAPQEHFHILGGGGTVGWVESMHASFLNIGPTELRIIGYATDAANKIINTKRMHRKKMHAFSGVSASFTKVILSVGSSMDSGKTTTAAHLVHGLRKQRKKVSYIKLTGTVYTKDADLVYDLGAEDALDFGCFGFPSTYLCHEQELLDLYESLLRKALEKHPEYVIIEIADGLFQRETKILLNNQRFMQTVDRVVFSAGDSLSAVHGLHTLRQWGIVPVALCGMFTASPLLIKEVEEQTTVPVYDLPGVVKRCAPQLLVSTQLKVAQ